MKLTPENLFVILDAALFGLGMVTFVIGVVILAFRSSGADVRTLATQAVRLAQKGLSEQVPGLVGNASSMLDALNQLVRTTRGVGIFLCLLGLALMALACWFAFQLYAG